MITGLTGLHNTFDIYKNQLVMHTKTSHHTWRHFWNIFSLLVSLVSEGTWKDLTWCVCVCVCLQTHVLICLSIDVGAGVCFSRPWHSEQQRVGLDHVAVARLELGAGHEQRGEGRRLRLLHVWVQRHLLLPCRHLLYGAADILQKERESEIIYRKH